MPHDLMGSPLAKGDTVTITFEVQEVHQTETACNVQLQAIRTAAFDEPYLPIVCCNSKLTMKVDPTPRAIFNMPIVTKSPRPKSDCTVECSCPD